MKISAVNSINYKNLSNSTDKTAKKSKNNTYKQINELPNNFYYPINFTRSLKEHHSWGVRVGQNGEDSTIKIFTYPDSKSVTLLLNEDTENEKSFELENNGDGVFSAVVPSGEIRNGDKYQFVIQKADDEIIKVKDPYSFKQPTILGQSEVYDQNKYKWSDSKWFSSDNSQRISRLASDDNEMMSPDNAIIYEINLASFTKDGNFESAKGELQRIKDTGFNSIELMPVENTYSFNWGYDGVDKFAPAQYLGGPDKLKELVDEAHNVGLNVIMDMVPNHLGPDGAQLGITGPYIKGSTPWGDSFNYEGENSKYVRDYMVNAALNWVENFHCDGIRFDMTKFMDSDTEMQQIAAELNNHCPDAFLIAEDSRSGITVHGDQYFQDYWQPHDQRVINRLTDNDTGYNQGDEVHNKKINDIEESRLSLSRLGFDSEWDFNYFHIMQKLAYGEVDLNSLERAIAESSHRIKYSTSHDETGNMDGTRLVAKYMVPYLKLNESTYLNEEDLKRANDYVEMKQKEGHNCSLEHAKRVVKSQKAQLNAMKLAQMVQTGVIDDCSKHYNKFVKLVLDKLCITQTDAITPKTIIDAFEHSVKIYRAMEAIKYFAPGPVMTFQGEENIDMSKFNFFREFDSVKDETYLYTQKGYPYGKKALDASKLGSLKYSRTGMKRMEQFETLIRDLNEYKKQNPASVSGRILLEDTVKHYQNPTIAMHAVDEKTGNEVYMVSNIASVDYPIYNIEFPDGEWEEVINSNDEKYGGTGSCSNDNVIIDGSQPKALTNISLPASSTLIFRKVS